MGPQPRNHIRYVRVQSRDEASNSESSEVGSLVEEAQSEVFIKPRIVETVSETSEEEDRDLSEAILALRRRETPGDLPVPGTEDRLFNTFFANRNVPATSVEAPEQSIVAQ